MLLRDDLSLRKAQKVAFGAIFQEADALRKERNLMLHSVSLPRSNQEKPFVRVKEDEREPEIDFDVATIEQLVNRMSACNRRTYGFFCDEIPGPRELPSRLFDSVNPGS
jgi:hypothetical protein